MFKNFHEIRTLAWISYSTYVRMWLEKGLVSQKHRAGIWSGSPLFGFEKRGTGPEDPIHDVLTGKLPEDTLGDPAACLWAPPPELWGRQDRVEGWRKSVAMVQQLLLRIQLHRELLAADWCTENVKTIIYSPLQYHSFTVDWPQCFCWHLSHWDLSIHKKPVLF